MYLHCSTEIDVENTIIANRRYLDSSKVLLDEVSNFIGWIEVMLGYARS